MSDASETNPTEPTFRSRLPGLLGLIGIIAVASLWFYNRHLDIRPVYLPLPTEAGKTNEATFIPTQTGIYELEVELRAPAERSVFDTHIKEPGKGGFDGAWSAFSGDDQIGHGKLSTYLYLSMTGPMRRRSRLVLGLESYRDISTSRMSRGVGRFRAKAGNAVRIQVQMNSAIPDGVGIGEPHLVVRVNRQMTNETLAKSLMIAFLFLIWFCVAGALWLKQRLRGHSAHKGK